LFRHLYLRAFELTAQERPLDRESFERLIASNDQLAPHADYLRSLLRPSVRITITGKSPTGLESRFGGKPMVPADFAWPHHDIGLYYFLGQINFAEITDRPASLPENGLLCLFNADYDPESDNEGEIFWRDDGYVKAWYFTDLSALAPMAPPHGHSVKAKTLTLAGELDIPRASDMRTDWPFNFDVLDALLDALLDDGSTFGAPAVTDGQLALDYLLGYPSYYSLAYDPTPGPDWISLLTLHSHDAFKWCWHDGDKLMVFIEQNRLASRDFSALKCDAG